MTSISLLPELLVLAEDDSFVVVDESEALTANRTKRIAKRNIALVTPTANAIPKADADGKLDVGWMPNTTGLDGWTPVTGTFAWASASTITISAGGASVYNVGDRLKWVTATGSTQRWGTVVIVADTLLTIIVNTDHVLANEAWTLPSYSHQASPVGFPPSFSYTVTQTGWAATPTFEFSDFYTIGRRVFVSVSISGTANATAKTLSIPVSMPHYRMATAFDGFYNLPDSGDLHYKVCCSNNGASVSTVKIEKYDGAALPTSAALLITIHGNYEF